MDFAQWALAVSQATNSSLAGSRVFVCDDALTAEGRDVLYAQMGEWGLAVTQARDDADLSFPNVPPAATLTGAQAIDRAARGMVVSAALADGLASSGVLAGVRVAVCLIVEPKTAVLLERLRLAGAEVGVYCHAHECDQRVANELVGRGFVVEACSSWTPEEEHAGALRLLDRLRPNLIVDDGANLARLLVMERPRLLDDFAGVAEETTSGVRAFEGMERVGELPFPVIAANDSRLKTAFDNRHGTGETCVTTMMAMLGCGCFVRSQVCVAGFGPVGEGFARRVRALGARVTIAEVDSARALEASYAGFEVCPLRDALATSDMVISATGVRHTITLAHLRRMREGAVVAVIGGVANEVALDEVAAAGGEVGVSVRGMSSLRVSDGPCLRLLADGDGVNYAAGPGNPIEVMDLSFSVQLCAIERLLTCRGRLPHKVIRLARQVDRRIARMALAARRLACDDASTSASDWRLTRYADAARL